MDRSRQSNAGFDYTLQTTTIYLGSMILGSCSGFIARSFGYSRAFAIAALLCLGGVWLVAIINDF